jgi:hypothetical protein
MKYSASNADSEPKTLIVERLIRPNYETVSPAVFEKTSTSNRFRIQLPAAGAATLDIVEEYPYRESHSVTNLNEDQLGIYVQNQALPLAARQALGRIVAKKREITENLRTLNSAQARINGLNSQMDRVRRNMESLNRVTGQQAQVQKLATELGTLQVEAAAREAELERARDRDLALKQELDSLIESTQF